MDATTNMPITMPIIASLDIRNERICPVFGLVAADCFGGRGRSTSCRLQWQTVRLVEWYSHICESYNYLNLKQLHNWEIMETKIRNRVWKTAAKIAQNGQKKKQICQCSSLLEIPQLWSPIVLLKHIFARNKKSSHFLLLIIFLFYFSFWCLVSYCRYQIDCIHKPGAERLQSPSSAIASPLLRAIRYSSASCSMGRLPALALSSTDL